MITIYRTTNDELRTLTDIEAGCWINIVAPLGVEVVDLAKKLDIPLDYLTTALDPDERSRVEHEGENNLIIVRIPVHSSEHPEIPYTTISFGIILTPRALITICAQETEVLRQLTSKKGKKPSTNERKKIILHVFNEANLLFLKYLKQINITLDSVETDLRSSQKNAQLIKLLNIEKCLVYFETSLKANNVMYSRFGKIFDKYFDEGESDTFDTILVDGLQAQEMADIYNNILVGMMDAFASIISNNLNVVMKTLTIISISLMIPTLFASFYGMNITLPLQDHPFAFGIILAVSLASTLIAILIFLRRKWF